MLNTTSIRTLVALPAVLLVLAGCSSDTDFDFEASETQAAADAALVSPPQALFSPSDQVIPFPNNLLFAGSQDGTLNIPIPEEQQVLSNPQFALNQLDGFSTSSPLVTNVSEALDPATLVLGDTVRVFEVTTLDTPAEARSVVTGSVGEITDPQAMNVVEINGQLVITPIVPLKPSTSYMVVLTNGIQDMQGAAMQASLVYSLLQGEDVLTDPTSEGLRMTIGSHSQVLNLQLGVDPANVVLSWVFTTQSIRNVLQSVKDNTASSTLVLGPTGIATDNPAIGARGNADLFAGAIDLPYFQTAVGDDNNPLPALNGFWQNSDGNVPGAFDANGTPDFTPVKTTDVKVPVLMTIPNANSVGGGVMPADGWPVTIFQHGITGNRTQMLAIADAMADAGRAVIAIDMPLHGLTDTANPLHADSNPLEPTERTFDIDVVTIDPDTGFPSAGSDSIIDSSGTHFYSLTNLANTRDNLRQAIADLFVLSASLASAQIEGVQLDANNLSFVGHSLGGIVGTTLLSYDTTFQSATLAMPGGGIAQLLANSVNFGPVINAGLANNGVATGSREYFQFLTAAQAMVDSGDPINHAGIVADLGNTRIHLIEVIGDETIPNSVATAPLSGTEPLIRQLRLPAVNQTVTDSNAVVRFVVGDHGSILRPVDDQNPAETVEMQTQMAGFAQSRGTTLPVTDPSLLQAPVE